MASYFIIVFFLMLSSWQRMQNFCIKNLKISWFGRENLRETDPIRIKNVKEKLNWNRNFR